MLLDVTLRLRPNGGNLPYLDLSSMLYNEGSTISKATYFFFLISSISSIILSFARVLTWGDKPIITSFLSFRFLKISLYIVTKFAILSYSFSSIITMVIWGKVYRPMEDNPKDEQVFETYWRGLNTDDALVTFDAQMNLLPKIWIFGQLVPALTFASYLSIKFFGSLSFYKIYVENAVILVFALVTNISFFKRTWEERKEEDVEEFSFASHPSVSLASHRSVSSEAYSSGKYRFLFSLFRIYSSDSDNFEYILQIV